MVKVVAIVDSRNMRGLAASLLGFARNPTSHGLDAAVERFGLEIVESHFSIAIPRASDRQHLQREYEVNEEYRAYLERDSRVRILEGSLRRYQDGSKEEKMVDVLCAVECVRQAKRIADGDSEAEAVVVFSQDIDLKPGVQLAIEFDVPILVASPGAIHNRGIPYIAMAEPVLADLVQANKVGVNGQQLRQALATAMANPGVDSWEFLYTKRIAGERVAILRHRHGYEGAADPEILYEQGKGSLHDLGVIGVAEGLPTGFPRALLGLNAHLSEDLLKGTVVARYGLFSATVDLDAGRQVTVEVSNSYLTPGTRVLVHDRGGQRKGRYVGALSDPPPLVGSGGREIPATSVTAEVTEHQGRHAIGFAEGHGFEVFLPGRRDQTNIGQRYVVSLVGSGRDRDAPFVGHLASTKLP
ncbi:MAG: hypothetical protein WAN34_04745 [Acidimicrobiia bacterium]